MRIDDITPENMAALAEQGFTETDVALLAKEEFDALLYVEKDDGAVTSDTSDPHGKAQAEQDAALETAKTTTTEDNKAADNVSQVTPDTPFIPQYNADVPEDAAEQIKQAKGEESAAFKELMDGTIDSDAYRIIKDKSEAVIDELKTKILTANLNAQANEQAAANDWNKTQAAQFNAFKYEGIDYKAKPALLAAYNTNLRALGADPKNEQKDASWFLSEAHRMTKEDIGFVAAKKPVVASRNGVDLSELPPTLRNVPVAATGQVNADEFAHLRSLDGIALERAVAKLTNDQADRWMSE